MLLLEGLSSSAHSRYNTHIANQINFPDSPQTKAFHGNFGCALWKPQTASCTFTVEGVPNWKNLHLWPKAPPVLSAQTATWTVWSVFFSFLHFEGLSTNRSSFIWRNFFDLSPQGMLIVVNRFILPRFMVSSQWLRETKLKKHHIRSKFQSNASLLLCYLKDHNSAQRINLAPDSSTNLSGTWCLIVENFTTTYLLANLPLLHFQPMHSGLHLNLQLKRLHW